MIQSTVLPHNKQRPIMTQESIKQLLNLEQLYHSKYLTTQLLNQMVSLYVFSVECFDQKYAPMRAYFLGKIQQVLSKPEITKLLEGTSGEEQKFRDTIRMSGYLGMSQIEQPLNDRQFHKKNSVQRSVNDEGRVKDRHMKIQMQMKVMRQVEENIRNISKEVQIRDKKQAEKGKQIHNALQSQENALNQRLARRKNKLRKKSADHFKAGNDEIQPKIAVEQLKVVKKQLDEAVARFTIRMTQKNTGGLLQSSDPNKQQKGRVKMGRVEQESDDEQQQRQIVPNLIAKKPGTSPKQQQFHIQGTKESQTRLYRQNQQRQRENPTERIGTAHDPQDKGRVTVRKRSESSDDDEETYF